MITSAAKTAIHEIVSTWETGSPTLRYGVISILADGAGFTGGFEQGTDKSGTIDRVVQTYIDMKGKYADEFRGYTDELEANLSVQVDPKNPPPWAVSFMALWRRAAAEDAWFCRAQDLVFDTLYWQPMAQQAAAAKLVLPLSLGVCYDICIQSGPGALPKMRRLFPEAAPSNHGDEQAWTKALVTARRKWLAGFVGKDDAHTRLVRNTTYRMDGWTALIDKGNWNLTTPFLLPLRDRTITIRG